MRLYLCLSTPLLSNLRARLSESGYVAIHTFGLLLGTVLLPSSPTTFRRMLQEHQNSSSSSSSLRKKYDEDEDSGEESEVEKDLSSAVPNSRSPSTQPQRQTGKAAFELFGYSLSWWTLLAVTSLALSLSGKGADLRMVHRLPSGIGRQVSRRLVRCSTRRKRGPFELTLV